MTSGVQSQLHIPTKGQRCSRLKKRRKRREKKNPFPRRSHLTPAPSSPGFPGFPLPPAPATTRGSGPRARSRRYRPGCARSRGPGVSRVSGRTAAREPRGFQSGSPTPWRSPPRWGTPAHLALRTPDRGPPEGPCPAAHSQAPGTLRHVTVDKLLRGQSVRRFHRGGGAAQGQRCRTTRPPASCWDHRLPISS